MSKIRLVLMVIYIYNDRQEMASFFEPSRDAIVDVVKEQHRAASHPISVCSTICHDSVYGFAHHFFQTVLLVGGFAASPWLFSALQGNLESLGLRLFRPDAHT